MACCQRQVDAAGRLLVDQLPGLCAAHGDSRHQQCQRPLVDDSQFVTGARLRFWPARGPCPPARPSCPAAGRCGPPRRRAARQSLRPRRASDPRAERVGRLAGRTRPPCHPGSPPGCRSCPGSRVGCAGPRNPRARTRHPGSGASGRCSCPVRPIMRSPSLTAWGAALAYHAAG